MCFRELPQAQDSDKGIFYFNVAKSSHQIPGERKRTASTNHHGKESKTDLAR
jgi:hypothetical protein